MNFEFVIRNPFKEDANKKKATKKWNYKYLKLIIIFFKWI